ncbi:hypothetical protein BH09MYX1_BH09MYX1_05180 [soil metagenome]
MADTIKLVDFLKSKKLDTRRVLTASHKLESFRVEDKEIKLNKRRAKGGDENVKKEERKPRTGRPVTDRAIAAALSGKSISGPMKQRILRAVNYLLEQKKAEKVDLKTLF